MADEPCYGFNNHRAKVSSGSTMNPQQTGTSRRLEPAGAGAALCLEEELAAAIHGAFECAVEIAVREVTKLVGKTGNAYEDMRRENESLRQRLKRAEALLDSACVEERGGGSPPTKLVPNGINPTDPPPQLISNGKSRDPNVGHVNSCMGVRGDAPLGGPSCANQLPDPQPKQEEQRSGGDVRTLHASDAACGEGGDDGCAVACDVLTREVSDAMSRVCVVRVESMEQSCREVAAQHYNLPPLPSADDEVKASSKQFTVKQERPEEEGDDSACCLDSIKIEDFSPECMTEAQLKMLEEWKPEVLDIQCQDSDAPLARLALDMDDIATFVKEALPMCSMPATLQPIMMDVLKDVGVETIDDMQLIQINDLARVLTPIQARKLIAHVKSVFSAQTDAASSIEEDFTNTPQPQETPRVPTSLSIPSTSQSSFGSPGTPQTLGKPFQTSFGSCISSTSGSECSSPNRKLGSDWHYYFQVPWNMLPAVVKNKLHNQERPTATERREIIRIVTAEILATCKTPAKKHLSEVARKMVLEYPKSFKDIIEGEVVGSGYDSLTKQLQCRVDNHKRNETVGKKRIIPDDIRTVPKYKKQRKGSYGCLQLESGPVNVEAQMKKKKNMQKMFLENERNEKKIERLISDTFMSQRNDIMSRKDTQALTEEWPLLFSLVGMKAHFKLLTGVHINEGFEEAMASKLARVLEYFQSLPLEKTSLAAKQRAEIQAGGGPCGAVLMLLSHFKEDRARMLHMVDRTCIAVEVETEHLPPTPCIVVCGESPLSATAFMVAADQEVMMDNLKSFTDALVGMFMCFFIFNMHYPVELGSTMEFLQRCIFKINPDKGSKVERHEKKKSNAVNPKVLTLINRIAEFECST